MKTTSIFRLRSVSRKFEEYFGVPIWRFLLWVNILLSGHIVIDVAEFEQYLFERFKGEADYWLRGESMISFIEEQFGKDAAEFLLTIVYM